MNTRNSGRLDFGIIVTGLVCVAALGVGCGSRDVPGPLPCYRLDDNLDKAVSVQASTPETQSQDRAFTFHDKNAVVWSAGKPGSSCTIREGMLVFDAPEPDAITSPGNLGISGSSIDTIILRMRTTGPDKVLLSWRVRGGNWSETYRAAVIRTVDSETIVTHQIQMSSVTGWSRRTIDEIRLTLEKPGTLELETLALMSKQTRLAREKVGRGEFGIGYSTRSCLYVHCPGAIEYNVTMPERAMFSAGLGLMDENSPITFTLLVEENGNPKTLFSKQVSSEVWEDISLDLAEYAGREVRVTLKSDCATSGAVALWSNPSVYEARRAPSIWHRRSTGPPNVVLYIIDALRADHLPAYGYERDTAPNLTAFARQGILFANCFSQETWTQPSIASLMTSVDSHVHGIERRGNILPDALIVFPEILRRAGYTTATLSENPHNPPHMNPRAAYSNVEAPYLRLNAGDDQLEWNMAWCEQSDITAEMAATFLKTHTDRPFFLCVHTMECHHVPPSREFPMPHYGPPEPFRSLFASADGVRPADINTYDGAIRYADTHFLRFMDELEALGLDDNTIVIVTADHGEGFEPTRWVGHQGIPFIELVHVPLLIRWPGFLPAGKRIEENVQLLDLAPSILDFLNRPKDPQFQGLSLLPLIRGAEPEAFANRIAFSYWKGHLSAVQGPWKLMVDPVKNTKQLFNIKHDPNETRDVAPENPAVFKSLSAAAQAYIEDTAWADKIRHEEAEQTLHFDPRTDEMLRALGYLGE